MASVSEDGVQLWDLAAAREGDKLLATMPVGWGLAVAFDPAGDALMTDDPDVGFRRWPIALDPRTGAVRIGPPRSPGLCSQSPALWHPYEPDFALSADGRTVAQSARCGHVLIFDWENPQRRLLIEGHCLRHAAFSRDGQWLATGNWHGKGARVWDAQTGKEEHNFDVPAPGDGAAWPAFSPDGKWLVIGTAEEYSFWEVGTWQKRHTVAREGAGKARGWVVFSPDSRMVAVLHSVSEVRLLDPGDGHEFARLPSNGTPYCFSPDGSQLVTYAGRGGAMHVWDLRQIRRQLKEMDLDWDLPPYPPPPSEMVNSLRVEVQAGERPARTDELRAEAHLDRGILYLRLRKHYPAWDDFVRAATIDPDRPPWERVVRACSQELERNPDDADAYDVRARAYGQLGRYERAIDDHGQALRRDPRRPDFLLRRGWTYLRAGQKDRAAEDLRGATGGDAARANVLAWEFATLPDLAFREPRLAVALAEQAVRQAPGEASYWNTLGVAHYRAGAWAAAVRALEESEKLEPTGCLACNALFLAMCHHRLGDPARARDQYDRAARWCLDNQDKLSSARQQELKAIQAEASALLKVPTGP
jgi:tetratricopeptide (TPR) repeat protein